MQYRISQHARDRMRERSIDEADIVAVLTNHHSCWHDAKQFSMVLKGITANGDELVVFVHGDQWPVVGTIRVKSAAWRAK